jgi:peptidoglycan/LPS O-acetylase OafA/YrhL
LALQCRRLLARDSPVVLKVADEATSSPAARRDAFGNAVRLTQLDGLRGLAASMVVGYHFTTRYDESYIHHGSLSLTLPKGFLGVNLFFAISGFVILMTLRRTDSPIDFVVSRLSRLYPTFWAAVAISSAVVLLAGLPGHHPGPATIVGNLLMFHGLFLVPHVDGVYWSLEVELIFYVWMLTFWCFGLLRNPLRAFSAWLLVSLAAAVLPPLFSVRIPWTVEHLALLTWIPWFALGVATYENAGRENKPGAAHFVMLLAVTQIGLTAGPVEAAWAIVVALLLNFAVKGKIAVLAVKPIALLGAISYPLYLLHEDLGFAMMLRAERSGLSSALAVGLAIAIVVVLALIVHLAVERPATHRIRAWHRRGRTTRVVGGAGSSPLVWGAGALSTLVIVAVAMQVSNGLRVANRRDLAARPGASSPRPLAVHCARATPRTDWWLLIDDVPLDADLADKVPTAGGFAGSRDRPCDAAGTPGGLATMLLENSRRTIDVLPGLLVSFPPELRDFGQPQDKPVGFSRLGRPQQASGGSAPSPTVILWQRTGWALTQDLTADQYRDELFDHVQRLREAGLDAPVLVARDALCRGDPFGVISRAQQRLPFTAEAGRLGIFGGPDIDGARRPDGRLRDCMLVAEGRRRAAALWNLTLRKHVQAP